MGDNKESNGRGKVMPAHDLETAPDGALAVSGLDLRGYRARVLHDSKSRPVLTYSATYFDPSKDKLVKKVIIGKGYYRDDGPGTYAFMRQLWSDGFGQDRSLTIPEPMAYCPEHRLLLQGRAPGKPLYAYIDAPESAVRQVRLTARWLAKLHGASVTAVPVVSPEREEEKVRAYVEALVRVIPGFAARVGRIGERVIAGIKTLDPGRLAPTHGDFQPKNVHILRNRVTVIDFDRYALGDPGRDLGHFVAQCMTMSYVRAGSFERIRPWNEAFLDEYERLAMPGALSTLPVFIGRTFLEILYYKLFVKPVKDAYFVPAWLDECERWLDEVRAPAALPIEADAGSLGAGVAAR